MTHHRRWARFIFFLLFTFAVPSAVLAVEIGDKAPEFELPSTRGGKLKLSSFRGSKNVLIEFYVLDFTAT